MQKLKWGHWMVTQSTWMYQQAPYKPQARRYSWLKGNRPLGNPVRMGWSQDKNVQASGALHSLGLQSTPSIRMQWFCGSTIPGLRTQHSWYWKAQGICSPEAAIHLSIRLLIESGQWPWVAPVRTALFSVDTIRQKWRAAFRDEGRLLDTLLSDGLKCRRRPRKSSSSF